VRPVKTLLLLFALALAVMPAQAQMSRDRLQVLAAEIGPVYAIGSDLTEVWLALADGSAAFDEFGLEQITLDEAIGRGRRSMQGMADRIAALDRRAEQMSLSPTGDGRIDATLQEAVRFLREMPGTLRQMLAAVEEQVAAAEADDLDAVWRISDEMAALAVLQIDRENAMMRLQLATIDRRHPQHWLSAVWIASNDGMRHLAALSSASDGELLETLEAIPQGMQAAAAEMRRAIAKSRAAVAEMRARAGQSGWIAEILSLQGAADRRLIADVADEYEQALAIEDQIADLLDHGAGLMARLAAGDAADEVTSGLIAFDRRYGELFLQRQAEAGDRVRLLQAWRKL